MNPAGYGPSRARLYFDKDESKFELWEVKFLAHLQTLELASTIILNAADGSVADGDIDAEKNVDGQQSVSVTTWTCCLPVLLLLVNRYVIERFDMSVLLF